MADQTTRNKKKAIGKVLLVWKFSVFVEPQGHVCFENCEIQTKLHTFKCATKGNKNQKIW